MRLNRLIILSFVSLYYSLPTWAVMPGLPNLPGGVDAGRTSQNIQQITNTVNDTIDQVNQPLPLTELIAKTIWTTGNVNALSNNAQRRLQRGSPLYTRDKVVTDQSGKGEIAFTDGSSLTLRSETTIVLSQYQHGKTSPRNDKLIINVIKGGFRTITGRISKNNPSGYSVRTPIATIGVRGTDYDVNYNPGSRRLAVSISSGSITVSPVSGAPFVLTQGTQNVAALVTTKGTKIFNSVPPELRGSLKFIPGVDNVPQKKNQIKVSPCP